MSAGRVRVPVRTRETEFAAGTYGPSAALGARLICAGVGLGVVLLLLGLFVKTGPMTTAGTDTDWLVSSARNGLFTPIAKLFTLVATPELWGVLGLVIPIVLVLARRRGQALRVFGVLVGSAGVTFVAKALIDEHRPTKKLWLEPASSGSFPSGHSAAAWAIVVTAVILVPPAAKRGVAIGGAIFAVLVMGSRVYLGVHYPGDTVGGALATAAVVVFLAGLSRMPPLRRWLPALDRSGRDDRPPYPARVGTGR
ncbi:hypothetical protein Athai_57280 [Actinocatenispora thailandica]|uniref:Phosphatidic acid phosphatase type 2/haloperoxidase domain-containing protein n=1 Tax=Actinocatenispora thailandica TaxID=227318 RepID=A0A7R7DV04_9ACTN|nr:phosphatase PAP2 family protein [Actinocatenispora thailandica]BCJ38225.1 hypothetical protein Athai_57280 [Actinocatenispora thailandica]